MADGKDRPDDLEDISAGLLSGAMLTLLGCAIAGVVVWQVVAEATGRLPDLKAMTAGLPQPDFRAMTVGERNALFWKSVVGGSLVLLVTFGLIGRGVRHVQKNLALLRARRG
jgi:hypothetical protein